MDKSHKKIQQTTRR